MAFGGGYWRPSSTTKRQKSRTKRGRRRWGREKRQGREGHRKRTREIGEGERGGKEGQRREGVRGYVRTKESGLRSKRHLRDVVDH